MTTVDTADGPMDLYVAEPDAPPRTAVVVVQEAFGLNEHIQDVTRRFAEVGHLAVAPDIFHRSGGGTVAYDADFAQVLPLFEGLTDAGIVADVDTALARGADAGIAPAATGIVGYCFGGRATFLAALERPLGAAVGYYGGGLVSARFPAFPALLDRVAELQAPWLGLFGDQDHSIPVDDVEALRARLAAEAPVPNEVVRYPDAGHGFHCDQRADYHPASAADAWQRTLDWFDRHLVDGR